MHKQFRERLSAWGPWSWPGELVSGCRTLARVLEYSTYPVIIFVCMYSWNTYVPYLARWCLLWTLLGFYRATAVLTSARCFNKEFWYLVLIPGRYIRKTGRSKYDAMYVVDDDAHTYPPTRPVSVPTHYQESWNKLCVLSSFYPTTSLFTGRREGLMWWTHTPSTRSNYLS